MKRFINLLIFQILTFVSFSQTRTTSGDAIRREITPKYVNGAIKQLTISQLKAQAISNGDSTTLYYVTDTGKKGYFELDKNDNSSTGNDSTIIVTNNGKRLKRTIEQYLAPSTTGKYYRGDKTWQVITKSDIPTLSNVDNTSDANKPISTATQTALLGKLDKGYSISELRGLSNSVLSSTQIFYCNEAGKEGFWKYDAADNSSADNLGSVLVTEGGKRLKRIFDGNVLAKWFLQTSNTQDNTSQFKIGHDFAKSINRVYELEEGTYILSEIVNITTGIIGKGIDKTIVKLKDNSSIVNFNPVLKIVSDRAILEGLTVDGNRQNNLYTSTTGILGVGAYNSKQIKIQNIKIKNTRHIGLHIVSCYGFTVKNVTIDSCGRYGQQMPSAQADRIGCLIDNDVSNSSDNFAGKECTIDGLFIFGSGLDGLVTGVGATYRNVIANYNGLEYKNNATGAAGIYFRPPQFVDNVIVNDLSFINCTAKYNTGIGIDIGNNESSTRNPLVYGVIIENCNTSYNYLNGITVAGVNNAIIQSNISYNNGQQNLYSNVRRAGIGIDGLPGISTSGLVIKNNICFDNQSSKTQQNGIFIGSYGVINDAQIYSNNLTGNASSGVFFQNLSSIPTVLSVQNNVGFDTYNYTLSSSTIPAIAPKINLSASSNYTITNISNGAYGDIIELYNNSSFNITITNNSTIKNVENSNITLLPSKSATYKYIGSNVWRQILEKNQINELVSPLRVASANNEHMVGVLFSPTYNSNGFTGTRSSAIMVNGAIVPQSDNSIILGGYDLHWSSVRSRKFESLTGDMTIGSASGYNTIFQNYGNIVGQYTTDGSLVLQTGGTISSTGDKLQVSGNILTTGKLKIASGTNKSVGTITLTSGLGTITSTAITTNSIIWITTKTLSGTSAHDYTYNISADGTATITARQSNGSTETGCNSTIQYWIIN